MAGLGSEKAKHAVIVHTREKNCVWQCRAKARGVDLPEKFGPSKRLWWIKAARQVEGKKLEAIRGDADGQELLHLSGVRTLGAGERKRGRILMDQIQPML